MQAKWNLLQIYYVLYNKGLEFKNFIKDKHLLNLFLLVKNDAAPVETIVNDKSLIDISDFSNEDEYLIHICNEYEKAKARYDSGLIVKTAENEPKDEVKIETHSLKIYLAAPFFNDLQVHRVCIVENMLQQAGYEYFSPYRSSNLLFNPTKNKGEETFLLNMQQIDAADMIVAITNDKDTGTLFECGYAYAKNKKIIYVYDDGQEFNLMLANSGLGLLSFEDLKAALNNLKVVDFEILVEKQRRQLNVF